MKKAHLISKLAFSLVMIIGLSKSIKAQQFEWLANDFPNSVFRGIYEIDSEYLGVTTSVLENVPNAKCTFSILKIDIGENSGANLNVEEIRDFNFDDHYSTQAIKFITQTGVWMLFQAKFISHGFYNYRVILCDTSFNIITESSVDVHGYPLTFHIDSDDSETYLLGSLLGPPSNELVFLKYMHSKPIELSPIQVRQSEPRDMLFISSMKIDPRSKNMLVFSITGISVLDSNLYLVQDYNSEEVLTSTHGHVIGVGDFYYSHGARDSSWDVGLRKLVVHKYDKDFNVLVADTLGWPGQDNYPFSNQSIEYRNHELVVGGLLDGPLNHINLAESIKKFYLSKYDEDLNQIWYKEYGGDRAYLFFGLHILADGSCLAYGTVTDTATHIHYAYLIHVDENGEILTSYTSPQGSKTSFQIVNPGGNIFRILNPEHLQGRVEMYNMQGCHVMTGEINGGISEIDVENLPAGLYPYILIQDGHVIDSGKWIKTQ